MSTKAENKVPKQPKETKSHKRQVLLFGSLGIVVGAGLALAAYDSFMKIEEVLFAQPHPQAQKLVKPQIQAKIAQIEPPQKGVPSFVDAMANTSKEMVVLQKRLTDLEVELQKLSEKEIELPKVVSATIPMNIQQTPAKVELLLALQSIQMGEASGEWLKQIYTQFESLALQAAISDTSVVFQSPLVTEQDLLNLLENVVEEKIIKEEQPTESVEEISKPEPQSWKEKALEMASKYVQVSSLQEAEDDSVFAEAMLSLKKSVTLGDFEQALSLIQNTEFLKENNSLQTFVTTLELKNKQDQSLKKLFDTLKESDK